MTVLSNREKEIRLSLSDTIHEKREPNGHIRFTYTPVLPTVVCSEKVDAEYIQQRINTLINDISKDLLK